MQTVEEPKKNLKNTNPTNKQVEQFRNGAYSIKENDDDEQIREYRKILNDYQSSDKQILKKLQYLNAFCHNIARLELQNFRNKNIQTT